MSQLDLSGCKKRKRGEKVFKFKTFGEKGFPTEFHGSFQERVKGLLGFGQIENGLCGEMMSWSFQLEVHRHPSVHVFMFVVEEPIELSVNRHCKHCQYVGWGQHLICNKKYHFLLPSKDTILPCLSYEGNCPASLTESKLNLIELEGHTMHGVFHSNGFGHLLCINGMETSSDLAGYQLMDLWDRLCTALGARKVSLRDISHKRGMDLRLIHAVSYGEPWFGRWGYTFGRGGYGVNQQMYRSAIDAIQNIPISLLIHHLGSTNNNNNNNDILVTISKYQVLSGHSLITLGDIFHFMLELKSRLPKENSPESCNPGILVDNSCRWSSKRVEMAIKVIIEALKKAEFRWISRQEVRDAARMYIGDTGLLDFVLKSLGNHVVGRYFVRRCLNPVTKVLEYCLEDISHTFPKQENLRISDQPQCRITRVQLIKDIYYLYKHMLKEHKTISKADTFATILVASRIILDTKYLVKQYYEEPTSDPQVDKSNIYCTIVLANNSEKELKKAMPPYECFQLRRNATFDELKIEVEKTFREIYYGARSFTAESIANFNSSGSDLVFKQIKVGGKLVFQGFSEAVEDICEAINSDIVVDCPCGVKEDDSERMISCDICEIWQHTRCVNIPNSQEIPTIFLCTSCEQDILRFPSIP